MTDPLDQASEQEQMARDIAINQHYQQRKNAGLIGKTVDDSAVFCDDEECGISIPQQRREAVPGCRYCVSCQQRSELSKR